MSRKCGLNVEGLMFALAANSSIGIVSVKLGLPPGGVTDVCNDWQIDRRQHGLARAVIEDLVAEHNLLGSLGRHCQAKVVDTMHRFGRSIAAVKRKCRKSCQITTSVLGMMLDGTRQNLDCWHSGNISPSR
jgi:hypothetical protein